MKRVLIFSLAYFPFVAGAEVAIKQITDHLPDFEFEIITVNLDGRQKSKEKIDNVLVRRIGSGKLSKYFFPFTAAKLAKKLHQEKKFDAIWAIMANQAGMAALFFKKKHPALPYLLTLQEGDSEFDIWLRTFFIRPWYKQIYRSADYIQAISNFLANRAKKMGAKFPIAIIPNGAGLNYGQFMPRGNVQSGGIFNHKIVITSSRLEKKNGVDILIKAISLIEDTDIRLVIMGGGKLKNKLVKLAYNLKLKEKPGIEASAEKDRVYFFGHIDPLSIFYYLKQSKIFVRPSRSEGLGIAFLEAMACGLPVIGTPVGGIPDFLKDNETGLFCKVNDPKDLSEKIQRLLQEKDLYEKLSVNGKKLVEEKYQWEEIAEKMEKIFLSLEIS